MQVINLEYFLGYPLYIIYEYTWKKIYYLWKPKQRRCLFNIKDHAKIA